MNRAKRLLALLLVLATVLSIFPLQSLAAEVEEVSQEPETAETAELHAEEEPEEPSGDEAEVPAEEKPENFAEDQVETPIEKESEPEEGPADSSAPARQPARISSGAEVVADGISGDVSWTLYDDGTLVIGETITGSGKMADYPRSNARPWWRINNVVYLQQITSVIVKEGVTSIGDYAFFYMQKLTNLELPDSITSIGDSAFGTCRSLTSVVIPDAVTSIGNDAFNFAENLTDVVIPASLTNIGKDAFANTAWQKNQGDFPVVNGILIGYEGEGGVVTIPENVTAINTGAFAWCSSNYGDSNVTEIIIPDTVKSIGNQAFYYCTNLTTAVLPGSVTAIPEGMFQSCVSLTSVTIPEGVTRIEKSAFEACSSLTRIELPDGVTTIGNDAFSWCESLTQITIPASVTKIGNDAFDKVSKDLVIIGAVDSYAQQFATDRGFQFHGIMPLGSVELSKTVYTYSGEPCTPDATVRDSEGNLLEEGVDYVVTYSDNIDAGTATATVTGIGPYRGTITATYSIQSAAQVLVVTPSAVTVGMGETVQLNVTGFGTLHFSINQPNVATVGANGLVKGLTVGSAVITVKADGDRNHRAAVTTVPVSVILATPKITGIGNQLNGVAIVWGKVAGAAKYRVFRKLPNGWLTLGDTTGLTFTDTTAQSGQTYTYVVRCVSANGKSFTSAYDPTGRTIQYLAPPAISKVECALKGVQVTWGKVPGAVKYRVFRKLPNGWLTLGDTTGLTFTDTTAQSGQTYTYVVRCVSADGKSFTSAYDPTGRTIQYLVPPAVSRLDCVQTGVQVTWGKVPGAVKYRVFRKLPTGGWLTLGDTTGLTFTDTTAQSGQTYTYVVRCVSANGKSFTSAYIPTGRSIYYLSAPVVSGVESIQTGVKVTWGKVPGAVKYRVFRNLPSGGWQPLGDTTALTFVDTAVQSGQTFTYVVRCISADGKAFTSAYDPAGRTITFLSVPQIKSATNVAGGVNVQWAPVKGAVRYCVFRKSGSEGWKAVGTATGTSFTDTTVPRQSVQTYTVRCVSADGKRFTSAYDSAGVTISVPTYTTPNSYSFSVAYRTGVYYNRLMSVKVGSDQRQAILDVAQSQLGYTEGNNKNAIGGNASGSQNYTEFGLWYYNNIDSSDQFYLGAWCSMFVSWCANEAGIPADVIPRRALVAYMKDAFEKMGRYYAWTKSKCGGGKQDIRPGDLILFSTAPLGRLNHIGLVQNVTYKNGQVTIKTVEGNKGDQCCMKTYTLSTSSLTGYVTNEKVYIRGFACPAYNN